jgi:hypothetical protein
MPKAPVDECGDTQAGKDEIRLSGEVFSMKPISKARRMDGLPYEHFWSGITTSNGRHVAASGF